MIDVTKCMGCRQGITMFATKNGVLHHLDILTSSYSECKNQGNIEQYLVFGSSMGNNFDTYLSNDELRAFFDKQHDWWADIVELAWSVLGSPVKVTEFFNSHGDNMRTKTNEEIEKTLLEIAEKNGKLVNEQLYPHLMKYAGMA